MKYLALGDSYTIGESVNPPERWPHQLVSRLSESGIEISFPKIIATTGWTTGELIAAVEKEKPSKDYDLVSLLIGVNNQYRGYPMATYQNEFEELLESAIRCGRGIEKNVFVISIPDYGVTPFAAEKNPPKIAQELDQYNRIAKTICERYDAPFINIIDVSREAKYQQDLAAKDGLHPSGKMYSLWVDLIYPSVEKMLRPGSK